MKALLMMMLFANTTNLLAAQNSKALEVKEYKLENGLTVWLNEDHSQPKVFGAVVVKAGAKDCPDTGIAHYFEHMMFKGTDKIGTIDYEAEKFCSTLSLRNTTNWLLLKMKKSAPAYSRK